MKRLFVVDYREKGVSKHHCIEFDCVGFATDTAIVTACHVYVGMENELDNVIEVFSDMSATELDKISLSPEIAFLPMRVLYANIEELKRCAEILKGV